MESKNSLVEKSSQKKRVYNVFFLLYEILKLQKIKILKNETWFTVTVYLLVFPGANGREAVGMIIMEHEETLEMMDMFIALFLMMISQLSIC